MQEVDKKNILLKCKSGYIIHRLKIHPLLSVKVKSFYRCLWGPMDSFLLSGFISQNSPSPSLQFSHTDLVLPWSHAHYGLRTFALDILFSMLFFISLLSDLCSNVISARPSLITLFKIVILPQPILFIFYPDFFFSIALSLYDIVYILLMCLLSVTYSKT